MTLSAGRGPRVVECAQIQTRTDRSRSFARFALLALAGTALTFPAAAGAGTILAGDYIKIGLNDHGTLGSGGNAPPGILYDGTGTGTFNSAYDYLTPGSPFEGFTIKGTASGGAINAANNNNGGGPISGTLTDYSGVAFGGATYDNRAVWTGVYNSQVKITHDYYFDDDGQQLKIKTTIEALTDLTGVTFARYTDPDAVAAPGDSSATNNFRGSGDVSANDLVYAEAKVSKYVIGLYSADPTTHGTGVTYPWSQDPADYLSGQNDGNGDYSIGLGFDFGDLLTGQIISFDYSYIFGTDIAAAIEAGTGGRPNIGTGGTYTVDDLVGGGVNPVFDGGTLTLGSSGEVSADFTVEAAGGTIDTAGNDLSLTGALTGAGGIVKAGDGVLRLTGASTVTSMDVQGGVLEVGSQAALGADDAQITLRAGAGFSAGTDLAITQDVEIAGADTRFDTAGNDVVLSGALTGSACFTKVGAGSLNLVSAASNAIGACVEEGQLSFNNVFTGDVWVEAGGTAAGGGQVNGDMIVNGVLSPGNSPGQLVVAGSVTQSPSGVLAIDVDGPTAGIGAGHYDTLVLTGASSVYTAGGAIAPITRGITGSATNTYTPQIGDSFEVVTAEGGVTGAYSSVVQPTEGLPANTRFDVFYAPNAVILSVTPQSYAAIAGLGNLNAQSAARAIDSLRAAAASPVATPADAFGMGLAGLNEAALAQVLQQAAGEVHADSLDAMVQNNRAARAQLASRMEEGFLVGRRVWAQAGADNWELDSDARASGYRADRAGVLVGGDLRLNPGLLVGAAVGYGETEVEAGLMGRAKTLSYHGMAYAGWRSGAYYVNGVVAAGSDTYKTARTVDLSTGRRTLSAKPDGSSFAADLEAGRRLALGASQLTLSVGLASDQVDRDGVVETGDATAALSLGEETRRALQGRIGGKISREADFGQAKVTPHATLFVTQELDDVAAELGASLNGADFAVTAASPGRTAVKLGLGVEAVVNERARFSVGYRFGRSDRAESHAVSAVAAITW